MFKSGWRGILGQTIINPKQQQSILLVTDYKEKQASILRSNYDYHWVNKATSIPTRQDVEY
jgi:hypothetical protein